MDKTILNAARKNIGKNAYSVVSSLTMPHIEEFLSNYITELEFQLVTTRDFKEFEGLRSRIDAVLEVTTAMRGYAEGYSKLLKNKNEKEEEQDG